MMLKLNANNMAIELLKNTNTIEVVATGFNLNVKTVNGGQADEKKVFTFNGRLKKNKPTLLGTIKLSSISTKRIVKKTNLTKNDDSVDINSNLKLILKSTSKDSNSNIVEHLYDVIYTAKEPTTKKNKLKYSFVNEPRTIRNEHLQSHHIKTTKGYSITKIDLGGRQIGNNGGKNIIKLTGKPGTKFKIIINKVLPGESHESTITNPKLAVDGIISGVINTNGVYSFPQSFPSATVDTDYKVRVQSIHPTLTSSEIWYRGNSSWGPGFSNKLLSGQWEFGLPGWDYWTTSTISQSSIKKLTLRAETADASVQINGVRTVVDGHAVGDFIYKGFGPFKNPVRIKYVLTNRTCTTKSGGSNGLPIFSNDNQTYSDWTNSVPSANKGTLVDIYDVQITGSTTTTYTLSFSLMVHSFGTQDTTMTLDLDTVVAFS